MQPQLSLFLFLSIQISCTFTQNICYTEKVVSKPVTISYIDKETISYPCCPNIQCDPPVCTKVVPKKKTKTTFAHANVRKAECCQGYYTPKNRIIFDIDKIASLLCVPECPGGCGHGECQEPGKCRCYDGYQGANCDQICPENAFGFGCSGRCTCKMGELCDHVTGLCHCPHGVNCGQTTEFSQSAETTTEFKNLETTKQYNVKTTSEYESTYIETFDRKTEEVMELESDDIMTHNDTFIVRDGFHMVKSDDDQDSDYKMMLVIITLLTIILLLLAIISILLYKRNSRKPLPVEQTPMSLEINGPKCKENDYVFDFTVPNLSTKRMDDDYSYDTDDIVSSSSHHYYYID